MSRSRAKVTVDRLEPLLVVRRVMAGAWAWTNPTTNAVIPDATDRTGSTGTLVKTSALTDLVVVMHGTIVPFSAVVVTFGLRIGGTDYDITQHLMNSSIRNLFHGDRRITGVPAGSLTIEPFVRSSGAATIQTAADSDMISYTVREVPAA